MPDSSSARLHQLVERTLALPTNARPAFGDHWTVLAPVTRSPWAQLQLGPLAHRPTSQFDRSVQLLEDLAAFLDYLATEELRALAKAGWREAMTAAAKARIEAVGPRR